MMISEFSRQTGLARETVRYYVRMALLRPHTSSKGGRNPYLIFTEADVHVVETIRVGQALGLSLREIVELRGERRRGRLGLEQRILLMKDHLAKLEVKSAELERLKAYVRAKIAWQEAGEQGEEPGLGAFLDSVGPDSAGT